MKIALTGGTGFVGSRLARALAARGDRVVVVTRSPEGRAGGRGGDHAAEGGIEYAGWNLDLADCDAVVHLAGEPLIGKRWSPVQKGVIRASRIDSTRKLVAKLAECKACSVPKTFVCASAVGYYGDRGDELLPEEASAGQGFVSEVCVAWEAEAARAAEHGARVVSLRLGVVLGKDGGALERMLVPFRLGLGGPIGNGEQHMSWVHVDDVVGLVLHALDRGGVKGPLNATAPGAVRNREFSKALGRALHRPAVLPAPVFGLRLMIGEAAEILTASQRCVPRRTLESGFAFRYAWLDGALADLFAR